MMQELFLTTITVYMIMHFVIVSYLLQAPVTFIENSPLA